VNFAGIDSVEQATFEARISFKRCPLCDSERIADFTRGNCSRHPLYDPAIPAAMLWRKCVVCGHVFTEGYFTPEAEAVVFAKVHDYQKPGHDAERQRQISARIVDRVATTQGSAGGCWLDVGFGNGSLLHTADEWGYATVGIDWRTATVAAMTAIGYEAHRIDLLEFDHFGRFAVVSMADVLEHMPFPKAALKHVRQLLRPDGVIFVSMPNSESFVWKELDRAGINPYWGELEHYHNFSRTRLYALLRECGFEPIRYGISERYRACMEVIATVDARAAPANIDPMRR
jgi:SAM-dependent methyltransferase